MGTWLYGPAHASLPVEMNNVLAEIVTYLLFAPTDLCQIPFSNQIVGRNELLSLVIEGPVHASLRSKVHFVFVYSFELHLLLLNVFLTHRISLNWIFLLQSL